MGSALPSGIVTFLFTDVEGSTKLLHELGPERYAEALEEHRRIIRAACAARGGVEVDTQGDAFFVAFGDGTRAVAAAREAQERLAEGPIRVRMGLHTGTPHLTHEGYVGADVHLGARIAAVGHGGQVLVSESARAHADRDVIDLGEHRLKDFAKPVAIFQLGSAERFPPLRTISNTNLPRPASSFVGREREVDDVVAALRDGARLLTLTGPGGSGKTRLSIEAAARLIPDFKAGVFWIGLATLRDPGLVGDAIAQTLGAKDGLAEHIGDREMLLVLDNLEQVVAAAPHLADLVERCANLRLLVTSRELLRVRGEIEYPVLPLAGSDGVTLFCDRARTKPDETVRELCAALDNLPLALELAAGRASVLTPEQILERLSKRLDLLKGGRDADPRQQTLRATIEWSHELLNDEEQRLFARLAVFRGGCTLDAAEQLCDAELDTLQSLVDKSLVRHSDDRFWMLETIREYASEQLEVSGDADAYRRRLAEWVLALGAEAEPRLREYDHDWMRRLNTEHANVRAALDALEAAGETQRALELAGAVFWYWTQYGHLNEGRELIERLLRDRAPTRERAKALLAAADLAVDAGDAAKVDAAADEARALYSELGDDWGIAYAFFLRAMAGSVDGDWERGRQNLLEAVERFRRIGDEYYVIESTRRLAWMYESLGDLERSRAMHQENLLAARAAGRDRVAATTLSVLSGFAMNDGRVDDALAMARECIQVHAAAGDRYHTLVDLHRFARAFALQGEAAAAVQLVAAREALHEEIGMRIEPWLAEHDRDDLARARANLDEAAFTEAWKQGRKLTFDEAVALALGRLDEVSRASGS